MSMHHVDQVANGERFLRKFGKRRRKPNWSLTLLKIKEDPAEEVLRAEANPQIAVSPAVRIVEVEQQWTWPREADNSPAPILGTPEVGFNVTL